MPDMIPYSGGGILEPTEEEFEEFISNPQECEIHQLESGDVELSFTEPFQKPHICRLVLSPRQQIRITRLLLDCLRNQGLVE